jgi:hypothetical protein
VDGFLKRLIAAVAEKS